jgi:hypothetical protein
MCSEWEAKKKLYWMREAEMKHARLAMVAAAGWPISELLDKPLSAALGLASPLDATGGRAPSLLNGHLFDNSLITAFLVAVAIATVSSHAAAPAPGFFALCPFSSLFLFLFAALGLASPLDASGGRAPSLLNGHLFDNAAVIAFLVVVAIATVSLLAELHCPLLFRILLRTAHRATSPKAFSS